MNVSTYSHPLPITDVKVSVGMKKTDFLYPEWMQASVLSRNHSQLLYPPFFRPGFKMTRQRTYRTLSATTYTASSGPTLQSGTDNIRRPSLMDDLSSSGISGYDRSKQVQDLEMGNRRILFKAASCSIVEKVSVDSLRTSNASIQSKPSGHRTNGFRGSIYKGEQLLTQRTNKSNPGHDSDDLIAMGTLWIPMSNSALINNCTVRSSGTGQGTSVSSNSSIMSKSSILDPQSTNSSSNSNGNNNNAGSYRKSSDSHIRLNYNSSVNGMSNAMFGIQLSISSNKDNLKYQDPLIGAPASFQQRLMELASLEADTIRWERTRKVKKKPKPDRDS